VVSDNFNSHLLAITCVARSLVTACKTLRSHFYSFIADTEVLLNGFSVLTTIDWYRFVVQPATHSYLGLLVPSKGTDLNTLISTCYQNCKISLHLKKWKTRLFGGFGCQYASCMEVQLGMGFPLWCNDWVSV